MESSTLQGELPSMKITVANPNSPKLEGEKDRFADLRGVRWRINLGILPSSSSSIDDLRRVTADCRRRYASLRRRLLVDPHIPKDGSNTPALVMDNPLSQNPDSMWGRFFKNAELEKMVDQDLSRLYPEHGSYFQTPGCQGMLRRILLLWCLRHQEYGYRQGMHELLAPLLYVLHLDLEHLSQVRKLHEDHFTDKFDGLAFEESDLTYNFDFKKFSDSMEDEIIFQGKSIKPSSPGELNPEIQTIVFLSDAYGAEGELGILLSEKFMEHDAYCMFDALMSGSRGAIAMADFFSHSAAGGSHTGYPPVIEASSALYHLLYVVDSSLYSHLVELGVEPQYFALRWLRVLFGREFSLEDLLTIWDEIFTSDGCKSNNGAENGGPSFGILSSARGAFISGLAVSMILQLRASLLATENATSCLQRLLNFPQNSNLKKLLEKAKSLQALALDSKFVSLSPSFSEAYNRSSKPVRGHTHSHSTESVSSTNPLGLVPDSYWEEKWRVMQKAEELRESSLGQQVPSQRKRWTEKVRLSLSRSESDPSPLKMEKSKKDSKSSVRRSLLQDLSRQLDSGEVIEKSICNEGLRQNDPLIEEIEAEGQNCINNNSTFISDENCLSGNAQDHANNNSTFMAEENCMSGNTGSEENSSIFSASNSTSALSVHNHHHENDLEKSSVASNSSIEYNEDEPNNNTYSFQNILENPSLPVSDFPNISEDIALQSSSNKESLDKDKSVVSFKERKPPSGKFIWFWKFGRNGAGEETSKKGGVPVAAEVTEVGSTVAQICSNSCVGDKEETVDQNVVATLKNLGQSMRENIQVIESVFQHEPIQTGTLENMSRSNIVGKGQVTAMAALKELRKISNLLSEM